MQTKLELITWRARENPKMRFTSLAHHLGEGFLLECFRELKKDKAPGIDGVTVRKYEERLEENLRELVVRLKGKKYRPQPEGKGVKSLQLTNSLHLICFRNGKTITNTIRKCIMSCDLPGQRAQGNLPGRP